MPMDMRSSIGADVDAIVGQNGNQPKYENRQIEQLVDQISQRIVNLFIQSGGKADLNKEIAKIVSAKDLNSDMIQRIVESVNTQIYLSEYAKKKGENVRDVLFNIADPNKIRECIENGKAVPDNKMKVDLKKSVVDIDDKNNSGNIDMQKKASTDEEIKHAFGYEYNDDSWNNPLLRSDEEIDRTAKNFLVKQATEMMEEVSNNVHNTFEDLRTSVESYASYLTKVAKFQFDIQALHDYVVDKAGVPAETEQFMRLATNEKIAMLKEAHKFPEELNIEIERPDFTKIAEELVQETKKPKLKGLGQHSRLTIDDQMKIDKMDPPKVILDNGDIVDSVNNIIDAVKNLGNKHKKYNDAVQKKAELRDMFLKTAGLNVGDELALTKYIFEKEREKSASIKDVLTGKRYGEASRLKEVAQEIADLSDYNANKVIEPERLGDKIRHYYHQNHPQFTEDQINDHVNKMVDRYKGVKVIDAVKDMEDNADPIILREGMKTIGAWGAIGGASAVGAKKGYDALKARQKQHQDAFNQGQTKSMGFDSLKTNQNALQGAHETAGNMYQQHRY